MLYLIRIVCLACGVILPQLASANVAVLANRTVSAINVELREIGTSSRNMIIQSGDSQPVFFQHAMQIRFGDVLQPQQLLLQPGCAYFFRRGASDKQLQLEQIGLGESSAKPATGSSTIVVAKRDPVTISVKLFADENEPTHRSIWEPKLRKRVVEASQILERHSGVRLNIVEVGTWDSDEKQHNFLLSLREFEKEVETEPGQLAIGFSSQYRASRGRAHLGVTRQPMHSHILLKERSRDLLEGERLELLVHELGHYLGASHSPEPQSVMRPVLTRGLQRSVGARIQFDPVNALVMGLIADDMRQHGVRDFRKLSKPTRERLKQIYGVLQQAIPHDPAARQFIRALNLISRAQRVPVVRPRPAQRTPPLAQDTRKILEGLLVVANELNHGAQADGAQLSGDELTNAYVRQAAQSATRLRSANAKRALLLALGIFMDSTDTLRTFPGTATFVGQVESAEQHTDRVDQMGEPTMRDRSDLVKHFFVSAHLVVVGGAEAAAKAGLAKEMLDSQGGTGFSFIDMAANHAGIVFAERLLEDQLKLSELGATFHVDDFLPTLRGLEEGLTSTELQEKFGGDDQPTISKAIENIEARVLRLPVYDRPSE